MKTTSKKSSSKSDLPEYKTCSGISSPNYTNVPDEFFDYYVAYLSESELKVSLYIIRRTFGFKKEADTISLSQLEKGIVKKDGTVLDYGTGLSRPSIVKAIKGLLEKGIIEADKSLSRSGGYSTTSYKLHMKAKEEGVVKNINHPSKKSLPPLVKNFNPQETVLQKTVKQKDTISRKENLKTENAENAKRGGGFKSFEEILEARVGGKKNKTPAVNLSDSTDVPKPPQDEIRAVSKNTPSKIAPHPLREPSNLEAVIVKISKDIRDEKHQRENKKQAWNIYTRLREKGVSEEQFIDTLFGVRGLTLEVINKLNRPGAYFFEVLRDKWNIENTSIKLDILNTS